MSAKVVAVFWVSGNKSFAVLFAGKVPKSTFSSHLFHRNHAKSSVDQRVLILNDLGEAYVPVKRVTFMIKTKSLWWAYFLPFDGKKIPRMLSLTLPHSGLMLKVTFAEKINHKPLVDIVCLVRLFSDFFKSDYFIRTLRKSFSINFPQFPVFSANQVCHLI